MKKKPGTKHKKLKKFDEDMQLKDSQIRARGLSNLCCLQPTSNHTQVMSQCTEALLS